MTCCHLPLTFNTASWHMRGHMHLNGDPPSEWFVRHLIHQQFVDEVLPGGAEPAARDASHRRHVHCFADFGIQREPRPLEVDRAARVLRGVDRRARAGRCAGLLAGRWT